MSKEDFPLSTSTQHLKNMIADAESDTGIKVLRFVVKHASQDAPADAILRMAKALLQHCVDDERGKWSRRN